jgi:CheY-like chemotaxis protein
MDFDGTADDPAVKSRPAALILVVDDDADNVTALQLLLSVVGFEVATARSAQEALSSIGQRRPDLIITDCEMPQMSGLALCRELRECDQTADIPLVLHTGKELPDGGPRPYDCSIAKTAGTDAILATIRALLSKHAAQLPQSPTVVTAE